jgi:hypothetical protein
MTAPRPTTAAAAPPAAVVLAAGTQPIFASAGGFPRLLYIPVPEFFDMHRSLPDATAISVSSVTGSIDASSSPERASAAAGPDGRLNIVTEVRGPGAASSRRRAGAKAVPLAGSPLLHALSLSHTHTQTHTHRHTHETPHRTTATTSTTTTSNHHARSSAR